ncbi:retrovirus-related pol polyprotein from transposon TNT 1-94 [Tanacetum coccineum]
MEITFSTGSLHKTKWWRNEKELTKVGPYVPTTVQVQAVEAAEGRPADNEVAGARGNSRQFQVVQQLGICALTARDMGHLCKGMQEAKRVKIRVSTWKDDDELEAHYSYMAKIQEVSPEESSSTGQPLEPGTVRFGNDQFAPILGYRDLIQGNVTIKRDIYLFCDVILQGNDLLTGSRGICCYTILLFEKQLHQLQSVSWLKLHQLKHEEGIEHQTSTPRTPEHNGVVKRRNRTLVEAARMMLSASKLPLSFWVEAVTTHAILQNRLIHLSLMERRHITSLMKEKPSIKHLHIFGCICYITRDGENLDKMKEKGDPCVMVGYSTQSKGYRVYNKRTRLIAESIHIKFDEIK